MQGKGLIHLYYGYGKGKSTAAFGLALRACSYGSKVVIVQFLKETPSGEIKQLQEIPEIKVLRGKGCNSFCGQMSESELEKCRNMHDDNLKTALKIVEDGQCDLLVLDELLDACQLQLIDEDLVHRAIEMKPESMELVITGHRPIEWIADRADYVTEMVKHKHPYDEGIIARKGIEF